MNVIRSLLVGVTLWFVTAGAALAHDAIGVDDHKRGSSTGYVNSIDKDKQTVNLSHGYTPGLMDMPMTMTFHVADPEMLEKLNVGDRINFVVYEEPGGLYFITEFEVLTEFN